MSQVPAATTPASALTAASSLLKALRAVGLDMSRQGARLMLAQLWFETGRGEKLRANSPGNLMARMFKGGKEVSVWDGDYWRPEWFDDETHPTHALMLAGKEPSAFRAYPTLDAGIADYVKLISRKAVLLDAFKSGSPSSVASAIVSSGYCPACPSSMSKTLSSLADGFKAQNFFNSLPDVPPRAGTGLLWAGVMGATAFIFFRTMRAA